MNEHGDLATSREREPERMRETGQAATRRGVTVGAGPRQEYLDAFDDQNYGRYRDPRAGSAGAGGSHGRHRGRGGGETRPAGGGRNGAARGGRGRVLVGIVAAAVVTVLAIVTVGRLADPDSDAADDGGVALPSELPRPDADDDADGGGGEGAPGPGDRPAGEAEQPGQPGDAEPELGFDELMDTTFEMAPDLTGSGELAPVPGSDAPADPSATTVVRYRVDVEEGIGLDPEFFAEAVHRTLNDPRSWGEDGTRSFTRVSAGEYDWVITLASPGTTAEWCEKSFLDVREDNVSCNSSSTERVMINAWRWAHGSQTYGDDIRGYREMLINHEVGHRLGFGHALCPGEGALAPVMMQQTKYLTTDGITCEPNPWPHPEAGQE
jgi:hypothetical protein